MKPLLMKVSLRNNALVKAREELGLTQREAGERSGTSIAYVSGMEALRLNPVDVRKGTWSSHAIKLAAFYEKSPKALWPDVVLAVKNSTQSMELDADDLRDLLPRVAPPTLEEDLSRKETLKATLEAADKALTSVQRDIIVRRYLLDETYEEIGKVYSISRTRTQQISERALSMLRNDLTKRGFHGQ